MQFFWLGLILGLQVIAQKFKIDTSTGLYLDELGRRRIFHGVNVVEKLPPFLPSQGEFDVLRSLNDDDIAKLRGWGMNAVRLGVLWSAVTPDEGYRNVTYLAEVKQLITKLAKHNIYTIVDAHQDLLNPFMCGEGMPQFAYLQALAAAHFNASDPGIAFPQPLSVHLNRNPDGTPVLADCQQKGFSMYYLTYQANAVFKSLYHANVTMKAFAASWAAVAEALGDCPGILGYELLNEPWPAGPGPFSDSTELLDLYQMAHAAIREYDNETIVMFEPLVLESYEAVFGYKTDFPAFGPGGEEYADRQVFAYHSYCANNDAGEPEPWLLCEFLIEEIWKGVDRSLAQIRLGGFLTEFGASGEGEDSIKELSRQCAHADQRLQSWTYWTYKSFDDITTANPATETFYNVDGSLQKTKVTALARTYAQAIAGVPTQMNFDPVSRLFSLNYTTSADVKPGALTEIYVCLELVYPEGVKVDIIPPSAATASLDQTFGILSVSHTPGLATNTHISVIVGPKTASLLQ